MDYSEWKDNYLKSNGLVEFNSNSLAKCMSDYVNYLRDYKKGKIFFITVNPYPDVDIKTFKKLVDKFLSRSFILNEYHCFEQTGKTEKEMGKHPHFHIVFDKKNTMSPAQMLDRTYNTFKSIVGSKKSCDVRVYDIEYKQDKIDYITGSKWDEEKQPAIQVNKIWREKYNLI